MSETAKRLCNQNGKLCLANEELFAEEFALSSNLPGSTPESTKAVDPIIRDDFKCSQAYFNAHYFRLNRAQFLGKFKDMSTLRDLPKMAVSYQLQTRKVAISETIALPTT